MRILHLCLSNYFNDGFLYQENQLVREHVRAGNDVLVVASTEVFDDKGYVTYTQPVDFVGVDGARVIRLPYRRFLPHMLALKIRSYPGVRAILDDFAPDAIMFHGSSAWELLTVARYVRDHPGTVFHIDSHADAHNSGHSAMSRNILHRRFYAPILRRAMEVSGPLLCVSMSVMDFAHEVYAIPRDRLQFFPLGGQIPDSAERAAMRSDMRDRLGVTEDTILLVQSGKLDRLKKLPQSLRALAQVDSPRLRLVIAGVLHDDVKAECVALIAADPRVTFLGWQPPEELTALLCAADVYLQPGSQSATMQHALCCCCAVILADVASHAPYRQGNGWFVDGDEALVEALRAIPNSDLAAMQAQSLKFAQSNLDYKYLAARVTTL